MGNIETMDEVDRPDKMRFRFLQMNDMHLHFDMHDDEPFVGVGSEHEEGYEGKNERFQWLLDEALNQYDPDFTLLIGDMVDAANPQRIGHQLKVMKGMLQDTGIPFYPIWGNHEVHQQEGNPEWEKPFMDVFGGFLEEGQTSYAFEQGGIQFIMLNTSGGGCGLAEEVYDLRAQWLRTVLEGSSLPKIICCHVPLVLVRDPFVFAESFGFVNDCTEPEILELVNQHSDSVLAVLSGHLHLTGMVFENSIHHISISGTASAPPGDFAIYSVFEDRIEVEVVGVPEELSPVDTNIHGKKRHGKDYVDGKHPTHAEYICGDAEERTFAIPLRK